MPYPPADPIVEYLALAYAALLLAASAAFEWTARRVHCRSQAYKTAGFTYEHEHDRWRCPTGNLLHRRAAGPRPPSGAGSADHHRVRVIYRAEAHICNGCNLKKDCTDSDEGRALELTPDAWVGSTMERFHRGMSLALVVLAELILLVAYSFRPRWLLLLAAAALVGAGFRLGQHFFHPADGA